MTEEIDKRSLIAIRDGTLEDINFIFSTWLKGLRYGNDFFKLIDQEAYFDKYHQVLEGVLSNPSTTVKVACLVEDQSVIIGYAVFRGLVLDWVFVKKPWRNIGIAKDLVPSDVSTITHITKIGVSLLAKNPKVRLNPFAL